MSGDWRRPPSHEMLCSAFIVTSLFFLRFTKIVDPGGLSHVFAGLDVFTKLMEKIRSPLVKGFPAVFDFTQTGIEVKGRIY